MLYIMYSIPYVWFEIYIATRYYICYIVFYILYTISPYKYRLWYNHYVLGTYLHTACYIIIMYWIPYYIYDTLYTIRHMCIRYGVACNTYYKLDWSHKPHTQGRIKGRCEGLVNTYIYIYIYAQAKLMKTIEKPKKTKQIKGCGPK